MLAAYSPTVLPQGNRVIPPHVFIHVNHHPQHYSISAFTQSPCGEGGGEYCGARRSGRRLRCIGAEEHRNAKCEPNRLISRQGTRRRHFLHLEHPASRRYSASFCAPRGTCPILNFFIPYLVELWVSLCRAAFSRFTWVSMPPPHRHLCFPHGRTSIASQVSTVRLSRGCF